MADNTRNRRAQGFDDSWVFSSTGIQKLSTDGRERYRTLNHDDVRTADLRARMLLVGSNGTKKWVQPVTRALWPKKGDLIWVNCRVDGPHYIHWDGLQMWGGWLCFWDGDE